MKKIKKSVRTRISLNASVDAVFDEYVGLIHALRAMKETDRTSGGSMAAGLFTKIDNIKFVGLLSMLLPLATLSKTFQTGAINFSRIKPNLSKTKAQLQRLAREDATEESPA